MLAAQDVRARSWVPLPVASIVPTSCAPTAWWRTSSCTALKATECWPWASCRTQKKTWRWRSLCIVVSTGLSYFASSARPATSPSVRSAPWWSILRVMSTTTWLRLVAEKLTTSFSWPSKPRSRPTICVVLLRVWSIAQTGCKSTTTRHRMKWTKHTTSTGRCLKKESRMPWRSSTVHTMPSNCRFLLQLSVCRSLLRGCTRDASSSTKSQSMQAILRSSCLRRC